MGLFYQVRVEYELAGFVDIGYLFDPDDSRLQFGYVFLHGGTAIFWRSNKQTLTATLSNHSELIALYDATRKCMWLQTLLDHI